MIKSFKYTFRQYLCIVLALTCVVAFFYAIDSLPRQNIQRAEAAEVENTQEEISDIAEKKADTPEQALELTMGSVIAPAIELAAESVAQTQSEVVVEAAKPTSPYASLLDDIDDYDRETLTRLIYHECRGNGGEAVAEVVLNRMLSPQFPDTLQDVVYQQNQFEPAEFLFSAEIHEPEAFDDCESVVETVLDPNYERQLPNYYLYFNSIGPNSEDYCWLGGNVFYGYSSDAV